MNELRTMHLFAGHGGGLLADLILGHSPRVAVEWDSYACQVLRERAADGWFPELQVWEGDVRLFDPSEYTGSVDIIHAGFPCQDISNAGTKAGVGPETRSGLYREVLRIAGMVRPKQLFLENVSAIVSGGLETVLADLIALGYESEWLCIRASDCGANHHRDRWFLLANSKSSGDRRDTGELQGEDEQKAAQRQEERVCKSHDASEILADPISAGQQRPGQSFDALNSEATETWEAANAFNGCKPGFWATEPNVGRVANGVSNRVHRLKGLGNAQVPLQAATAYRLLGGI